MSKAADATADPLARIDGTEAIIATGCHTSGPRVAHVPDENGDECARLNSSRTRTVDLEHQPEWYWRPCPFCWPEEAPGINPEGWSE